MVLGRFLTLLGLLALVSGLPAGAGPAKRSVADGQITLENDLLRAVIDGAKGGALVSFTLSPDTANLLPAPSFYETHVQPLGRVGALQGTRFDVDVSQGPAEGEEVQVKLSAPCKPSSYEGGGAGKKMRLPELYQEFPDASDIRVEKRYLLRSGANGLEMETTFANTGKKAVPFTFGVNAAFGHPRFKTRFFHPTRNGPRSFEGPAKRDTAFLYDVPDAWFAMVLPDRRALVAQFEVAKVSCVTTSGDEAKATMGIVSTTVTLEPGKTLAMKSWLMAVSGLKGVSFAAEGVAGHWQIDPPGQEDKPAEGGAALEIATEGEDLMKLPVYKADGNEEITGTLTLASAWSGESALKLSRKLNRTSVVEGVEERKAGLKAGEAKDFPLSLAIKRPGTWLLRAEVWSREKPLAAGETPLDVGLRTSFFLPRPEPARTGAVYGDFRYAQLQGLPPPHEIQADWQPTPDYISPHVPYAKPYAQGPIKALFICPFETTRGVIELWERLDLDYEVAIVGLHGYGKEHKYYSVGEDHATEDETDRVKDLLNKPHDVIVLGHYLWGWYPPDSGVHEEIVRQYKAGTGIVMSSAGKLFGYFKDLEEKAQPSEEFFPPAGFGKCSVFKNDFEEEGGRFAILPISDTVMRPQTWIGQSEAGVEQFARVVAWAARKEPKIRLEAPDCPDAGSLQDVAGRAVKLQLTHQGEEPFEGSLRLDVRQSLDAQYPSLYGSVEYVSRPYNTWEDAGQAAVPVALGARKTGEAELKLPSVKDGLYSLDFSLVDGKGRVASWYRRPLRVFSPAEITQVWLSKQGAEPYRADGGTRLSKGKVAPADLPKLSLYATDELTVRAVIETQEGWQAEGLSAAIDVTDRSNRVFGHSVQPLKLAENRAELTFKLSLVSAVHLMNVLRVRVESKDAVLSETRVALPIHRRPERTTDYKLRCYGYSMRWPDKTGIDIRSGIMAGYLCFQYAWVDQGMEEWGNYLDRATEITEDFVRIPCLLNPDYRRAATSAIKDSFASSISFVPPRAFLADEWTYASPRGTIEGAGASASLNQCRCRYCLERFQRFLRLEYRTLDALNAVWGTAFKRWEDATPPLFDETGLKWITEARMAHVLDHRCFIDTTVGEFVGLMDKAVKSLHPECAVGISGNEPITPWNNLDIWQLAQNGKHNIIYRYDEMWESFGVAGVSQWTGYSHKYRPYGEHARAWSFFLTGKCVSYYGKENDPIWRPDYGMFAGPEQLFEAVKTIKNGPAQLLWGQKARDPVAIVYHTRSIYADMIERNIRLEAMAGPALRERGGFGLETGSSYERLLHNSLFQPYWVSYEQLRNGKWDGLEESRLILLPYLTALRPDEVQTIRRLVEAGATVVGDVNTGMRDGHGKQQTTGSLDELFGLRREGGFQYPILRGGKDDTKTTVRFEMGQAGTFGMSFPAVAAPGIVPTTAQSHANYEVEGKKLPALLVNSVGKGKAILLNFIPSGYYAVLSGGLGGEVPVEINAEAETARRFEIVMNWILGQAGLKPPVAIQVNGKPGYPATFRRFSRGRASYLGFCGPGGLNPDEYAKHQEKAAIEAERHLYEILGGKYLGFGKEIAVSYGVLDLARLYSCLPYKVEKLDIALDKPEWKTSETVTFSASLAGSEPLQESDYHVIRAEVTDAKGEYRRFYRYCIPAPGGKGKGEIPLALNDPSGDWKLRLTDVATGVAAEKTFKVGK
jgi:hypothetical protein